MKRWILAAALAVVLVPLLSAKSSADPVDFDLQGVENPDLTAQANFAYDAAMGIITVSIRNNTSLLGGLDPRLTAFAFKLPEGVLITNFVVTDVDTGESLSGWRYLFKPNAIDTPGRFGFYDVAAITGPNFNGGKPNSGIRPGATFSFEFILSGPDLNLLTEQSFQNLTSYSRSRPVENLQWFIGRFQRTGIDGEGSDVAIPGELSDPEAPV